MKLPRTFRHAVFALALPALASARPARALLAYTDLPENQAAIERTAEQWQAELMGLETPVVAGAAEEGTPGLVSMRGSGEFPGSPFAPTGAPANGLPDPRALPHGRNSPLGWIPEPTPLLLAGLGLLMLAVRPARRALARIRR